MKVVILAGGKGTRLAEETRLRPKPMVEIGGRPILWHIMQIYASHGFREFLVAAGYKGKMIQRYFGALLGSSRDGHGSRRAAKQTRDEHAGWKVDVVDTGREAMTGGRVLRLREHIGNETFMVTYGDGLGNVDIQALLAFHRSHGRAATVTAVHPPARFGAIELQGNVVRQFSEKPPEGWINGGFFVFEPLLFDLLSDDSTILERSPMEHLANNHELMAFQHSGFWQPMDTLREKQILEDLWAGGDPPWRTWS